jgi:hypothetical protein
LVSWRLISTNLIIFRDVAEQVLPNLFIKKNEVGQNSFTHIPVDISKEWNEKISLILR